MKPSTLADTMKYPMTPAPEHLKPVLKSVLSSIKEDMSTKGYTDFPLSRRCLYICLRLDAIPGKESAEAAKFIQSCLECGLEIEGGPSLGSWQVDNDTDYLDVAFGDEDHYENLTRVAWLEWITKEDSNAAPTDTGT